MDLLIETIYEIEVLMLHTVKIIGKCYNTYISKIVVVYIFRYVREINLRLLLVVFVRQSIC